MNRLFVAAVISTNLLRSAECRVACQYLGYSTGRYESAHCLCIDEKDYREITNKQITIIPHKQAGVPPSSEHHPEVIFIPKDDPIEHHPEIFTTPFEEDPTGI